MERTNIALAGVLGLVVLASGVALWVASESPPPTPEPVAAPAPGPTKSKKKSPLVMRGPISRSGGLRGPAGLDRIIDRDGMPHVTQREAVPSGPPPKGSRLVVVTWDTVRSDHLSAYGYPRDTTPTFDALARQGVLFENHLVPQATTLPTHVSLFTGVHPDEHGITGNSASGTQRFVPASGLVPLARHLSNAGYATAGIVSSTPLKSFSGVSDGFQAWSEPRGRSRSGAETTAAALEWLKKAPDDRPVFLWVHYYDPHAPYQTPPGYQDTWADADAVRTWMEPRGIAAAGAEGEKRVDAIDQYDREIRYVDDQLGLLLGALDARGWSDAIVVVTGDHGEGLGQHGHLEHGLVWEEQLRAPLAIRAPGLAAERVTTPTTAQDVLPMLAALGDFPDEAGLLAPSSGRNVLADRNERPILSRMSRRQLHDLQDGGNQVMAWSFHSGPEQLIYREDGAHSLFDLSSDPHALHDLAKEKPARVAELVSEVEALNALHAKRFAELGAGKTETLDADTVGDLQALGYIE